MPAAPPMMASPAPIAPPSHAAPWLVRNVAFSAAPAASCANATEGIARTATPIAVNPRAILTACFLSIVVLSVRPERPALRLPPGERPSPIAIAVTPHDPHSPRPLRAWRLHGGP